MASTSPNDPPQSRKKFDLDCDHYRSEPTTPSGGSPFDRDAHPDSPSPTPVNPFSPPASVRSFSVIDSIASPSVHSSARAHSPFPDVSRSITSFQPSISSSYAASRPASRHGSGPLERNYSFRGAYPRQREAFTPPPARQITVYNTALSSKPKRDRPKSTMLSETVPLSKPWLEGEKDPHARISYWITYGVIFIGIVASAVRIYFGYKSIPLLKGNLCLVLDEDFSNGEEGIFGDTGKFFREVDMSGFGNGEFEMTTSSENNSFVKDSKLYIVPTLTSEVIGSQNVFDGYTFNLTDCTYNITQSAGYTSSECSATTPCVDGETWVASTSTSAFSTTGGNASTSMFNTEAYYRACSGVSNSSVGTIINPIQSARLTTRNSASIRFGKVEVVAKLPTGDWLWPAIWMLPVNDTYGTWPLSGEIDIMEARGNGPLYPKQGANFVRGSLNWGPMVFLNSVAKTFGYWTERWTAYNRGFHTYTLEWDEDFIRISVDSRLNRMLVLRFDEPFFKRGNFPMIVQNGSDAAVVLRNPWVNGTNATPFDQSFYLILDLSVGGTDGWFPDNAGGKPWVDGSKTAMRDFALAQDEWYPTWPKNLEERAMVIESVKMWQKC